MMQAWADYLNTQCAGRRESRAADEALNARNLRNPGTWHKARVIDKNRQKKGYRRFSAGAILRPRW